jgi:hypothetical protein
MALVVSVMLACLRFSAQAQGKEPRAMEYPIVYHTVKVGGLSIFYREAGLKDAPTILFLHGLPSSSRMFQPLLTRLADRYHLVAPDYPGFGHSDWPNPSQFAYTFDHIASVMNDFTQAMGLSHYTLYMQDYGGPVGFSNGVGPSGACAGTYCSRRGRSQRRLGRKLENAPGFLAGSSCQRKRATHKSLVA